MRKKLFIALLVAVFAACVALNSPAIWAAEESYTITNNYNFPAVEAGTFKTTAYGGFRVWLPFSPNDGLPENYGWTVKFQFNNDDRTSFLYEIDQLIDNNAGGKEIARIYFIKADSSPFLTDEYKQHYHEIVDNYMDEVVRNIIETFTTSTSLALSVFNKQWIYFGHSSANGYPVFYGVLRFPWTEDMDDPETYELSTMIIQKMVFFMTKNNIYNISCVFAEKDSERLEPMFDRIIGSIDLPADEADANSD